MLNRQIRSGLTHAEFRRALGLLGGGAAAAGLTFIVGGRFWLAHHLFRQSQA